MYHRAFALPPLSRDYPQIFRTPFKNMHFFRSFRVRWGEVFVVVKGNTFNTHRRQKIRATPTTWTEGEIIKAPNRFRKYLRHHYRPGEMRWIFSLVDHPSCRDRQEERGLLLSEEANGMSSKILLRIFTQIRYSNSPLSLEHFKCCVVSRLFFP